MKKYAVARAVIAQAAINNVAYDTLPNQNPSAFDLYGADTKSIRMERIEGIRGNGQTPAIGNARTADQGNEAVARLERLRKFYREAGDIAGVKYIAAAIRCVRRGEE